MHPAHREDASFPDPVSPGGDRASSTSTAIAGTGVIRAKLQLVDFTTAFVPRVFTDYNYQGAITALTAVSPTDAFGTGLQNERRAGMPVVISSFGWTERESKAPQPKAADVQSAQASFASRLELSARCPVLVTFASGDFREGSVANLVQQGARG